MQEVTKNFEFSNHVAENVFSALDFLCTPKPLRIAVALSGGPDSLSLLLLTQSWGQKNNCDVIALHVDHGLRETSKNEAHKLKSLCEDFDIECHVLTWEHSYKQASAKRARDARYHLLHSFCSNNNIDFLATGHHKGDQLETFLMRLDRGSNFKGLSGISAKTSLHQLTIIRPLLKQKKADLIAFLKENNHAIFNDPSNKSFCYTRNIYRHLLEEHIDHQTQELFSRTILAFSKMRSFFEKKAKEFDAHLTFEEHQISFFKKDFFDCCEKIQPWIFSRLCYLLSNTHHLNEEQIKRSVATLRESKNLTIANICFRHKKKKIILTIDPRHTKKQFLLENTPHLFVSSSDIKTINARKNAPPFTLI